MSAETSLVRTQSLGDRYSEWAVIGLTVLALIVGMVVRSSVVGQTKAFAAQGVSAEYPARWFASLESEAGTLLEAREPAGVYPTTYRIDSFAVPADATLDDAFMTRKLQLGSENMAFNVLDTVMATVNGREALKVTFTYVITDPSITRENLPVTVRGDEYLFLTGAGKALAVQFTAEADRYNEALPQYERFLVSVSF